MEACEEVADTFSDCEGCADYFSSRLGSLNLACTSHSFDPAFTFDTSSRSSSLRHCESTSRSAGGEVLHPAPTMLAAVSPSPCASSRRHVSVLRRTSLPSGQGDAHVRLCTSEWPARLPALSAETASGAAETSASESCGPSIRDIPSQFAGQKRRSCPDPLLSHSGSQHQDAANFAVGPCSEVTEPAAPPSPATSFASFAAALAAHYFADYGNVPDVPAHIEEVRLRAAKRQRVLAVDQAADR